MTNLHDKNKRYVSIYDSIITLVHEAQLFLNSDIANQERHVMADEPFVTYYKTVSIKLPRRSGTSTTAIRLWKRDRKNILIVRTQQAKNEILNHIALDDTVPNLFCLSDINEMVNGVFEPPPYIIVDDASFLSETTREVLFNFVVQFKNDETLFINLG